MAEIPLSNACRHAASHLGQRWTRNHNETRDSQVHLSLVRGSAAFLNVGEEVGVALVKQLRHFLYIVCGHCIADTDFPVLF